MLAFWLLAVSLVGVVVAASLRNQMILREKLPFPPGIATAETMKQIHSGGREAHERLKVLFSGIGVSAALKFTVDLIADIPKLAPQFAISVGERGQATFANLGLALDPSLLMVGFGALAGLRIGASALLGSIIAWGILAPYAVTAGWAQAGTADPDVSWFGPLVEWLLWPGVTLMVTSALTSFAFSVGGMIRRRLNAEATAGSEMPTVNRAAFAAAFLGVLVLASVAQVSIFSIGPVEAVCAVLFTFLLAGGRRRVVARPASPPSARSAR